MTLLQHLNSSSYVSNDAEISEILRMKNQKRIQNVMTGGGIIFDNTAKIEEQKTSKTTSVLINNFDNDLINNLIAKNFVLQEKSPKSCDADLSASLNSESRLSNSLTSESSLLSDNFPLLNSKSAREAPLSSPICVQAETEAEVDPKINILEPLKAENPFVSKPQNGTILSNSISFSNSKSNRIDGSSQHDRSLFDSFEPFSLEKMPFSITASAEPCSDSNSDTLKLNLNDLSSIEKKHLADKDPFAVSDSNLSIKTVFNIVDQKSCEGNFFSPLSSPNNGGIFKFTAKLSNNDSFDNDEDDNNNISSENDSDSGSDCESSVKPVVKSNAKSVNNIQILSDTLKSLKLSCWYYENLSHAEAIKLLSPTQPGTFLVRNSSDSKYLFTLSIQTYRQPTSIRIQYNDGKFCLDCENSVTETIPKFNSIMELIGHYIKLTGDTVHYINNNVLNENKQVLIDEYGKIFSNILLTKPLYSSTKIPSLKHLMRLNINRFTEFGYSFKIPSDELKKYINEYPFTI